MNKKIGLIQARAETNTNKQAHIEPHNTQPLNNNKGIVIIGLYGILLVDVLSKNITYF